MGDGARHGRSGTVQLSSDLNGLMSNLPVESRRLRRSEALRVRVLLGAASLALHAKMPDQGSHYLRLALQSTEIHGWRRPYGEIAAAIIPVLEAERRRITPYGELVVELLAYLRRQPVSGARLTDPLSERELRRCSIYRPLDQRELLCFVHLQEHAEDSPALDVPQTWPDTA